MRNEGEKGRKGKPGRTRRRRKTFEKQPKVEEKKRKGMQRFSKIKKASDVRVRLVVHRSVFESNTILALFVEINSYTQYCGFSGLSTNGIYRFQVSPTLQLYIWKAQLCCCLLNYYYYE